MTKYKTTGTVTIFSGEIGLSESQAKRRWSSLKKVKTGVYEIIKPVQFKSGEEVSTDTKDKMVLLHLDPVKEAAKGK